MVRLMKAGGRSLLLSLVGTAGAACAADSGLQPPQREALRRALQPLHAQYDASEQMLQLPFSSPGYHTTLQGGRVHSTRDSLRYAAALLDTGEPEHRERAIQILQRVIGLQDQSPDSKTYGIWSWFLEEPLSRMSPPDWNWADFCGRELLQVKLFHGEELPPEVGRQVDASIRHAAASIRRRNVGPGYSNIAILGTYVTLVAAETYNDADLRQYALERLRRLHQHTEEQGAFTEYNSPTYTLVSLKGLAQIRAQARDPDARRMAEDLYQFAWEEIATHFHPPTRQWAGPHSRCYATLLGPNVLGFIQRATQDRVNLGIRDEPLDLEAYRVPVDCPREFEPLFAKLDRARSVVKTYVKGSPPVVGTTYLHPAFTLGSVSRSDLWNQRRALVAYWGTAESPSCLQLRLLKDGYDFAAAQFFAIQREGRIVAAINFATDGGDTHVSLDRLRDGEFKTRDLRLRFELGGEARHVTPRRTEFSNGAEFAAEGISVRVQVPWARWGDSQARQELAEGAADWVLYSGDERSFHLPELETAAVGLGLAIGAAPLENGPPVARLAAGRLELEQGDLRLSVPVKPDRAGKLQQSASMGSQ